MTAPPSPRVEPVFTFFLADLFAKPGSPIRNRTAATMLRGGSLLGVIAIWCCLFCDGSEALSAPRRDRRQQPSPEVLHVDVLVLVDYALYKKWFDATDNSTLVLTSIRRYYTLVIQEASAQFSRLQIPSYRLQLNLVGFKIAQTTNEVDWTSSVPVNASQVLERLRTWLQNPPVSLPAYNHALLFTGENLGETSSGYRTAGKGTLGTVCKGPSADSRSVVEDRRAFKSVSTVVHEIGHGLNAKHDGDDNSCSSTDRYVMVARSSGVTEGNKRNPWFFSSCSVTEIGDYVGTVMSSTEGAECLRTPLTKMNDVPNVTGVIPGQLLDADAQCQRLYGTGSAFHYQGNLSQICTSLPCTDPSVPQQFYLEAAAMGTTCGSKKWCEVGMCVGAAAAPTVNETCYRDHATPLNGRTCALEVSAKPALCYDSEVYQACCQSCESQFTGIQGCRFGDEKGGCTPAVCGQLSADGTPFDDICCQTCEKKGAGSGSGSVPAAPGGTGAGQAVSPGGPLAFLTTAAFVSQIIWSCR